MKLQKTKINFSDHRGEIRDLLIVDDIGITHISSKKGTVRGNHYHKETMQYEYILSGSFEYHCKNIKKGKKMKRIVVAGHLVHIHPYDVHTFLALEDSEILSFNFGPSKGMDCHKDTFKPDENLL
ncbi:MAG TPA: cupin domain-containing protein [Candidatus Paceibacterota bacterium]